MPGETLDPNDPLKELEGTLLAKHIKENGVETHNLIVYKVGKGPFPGNTRAVAVIKNVMRRLRPRQDMSPYSKLSASTVDLTFQDLHAIVRTIATLEDEKYQYGERRERLRRFLNDAVDEDDFEKLKERYWPPKRTKRPSQEG